MARMNLVGTGSSPRLRGTQPFIAVADLHARFIPAPAGNALALPALPTCSAVHPRACGERSISICSFASAAGSSPRLRGTHPPSSRASSRRRFIPAPAGNASRAPAWMCRFAVHPRACGERSSRIHETASEPGSSPRLRGTRRASRAARVSFTVHPRACGERCTSPSTRTETVGSSPRLRGTRSDQHADGQDERFIPAPAGNALSAAFRKQIPTVHPRACGERCS